MNGLQHGVLSRQRGGRWIAATVWRPALVEKQWSSSVSHHHRRENDRMRLFSSSATKQEHHLHAFAPASSSVVIDGACGARPTSSVIVHARGTLATNTGVYRLAHSKLALPPSSRRRSEACIVKQQQSRHSSTAAAAQSSQKALADDVRQVMRAIPQPVSVITCNVVAASTTTAAATSITNSDDSSSTIRHHAHGATLSSLTSISLDPCPLVCFSLKLPSRMAEACLGGAGAATAGSSVSASPWPVSGLKKSLSSSDMATAKGPNANSAKDQDQGDTPPPKRVIIGVSFLSAHQQEIARVLSRPPVAAMAADLTSPSVTTSDAQRPMQQTRDEANELMGDASRWRWVDSEPVGVEEEQDGSGSTAASASASASSSSSVPETAVNQEGPRKSVVAREQGKRREQLDSRFNGFVDSASNTATSHQSPSSSSASTTATAAAAPIARGSLGGLVCEIVQAVPLAGLGTGSSTSAAGVGSPSENGSSSSSSMLFIARVVKVVKREQLLLDDAVRVDKGSNASKVDASDSNGPLLYHDRRYVTVGR